jgi:hypothetical protein
MTSKEIIKKIKVGKTNKITLIKTRASVDLWWETKDKWFCNVKRSKDDYSSWIIAPDLEGYLDYICKVNNYKIKEKE